MHGNQAISSPRQKKSTDDTILRLLAPSLLGIVACLICLMGMTWAWFSDGGTYPITHMQAADFTISAEVTQGGSVVPSTSENLWSLTAGAYSVTMAADGSSRTGGYCSIKLGEDVYSTVQLYPSSVTEAGAIHKVTFTVNVGMGASASLSVRPQWGAAPAGGDPLEDGRILTVDAAPAGDPGAENLPEIAEPDPDEPQPSASPAEKQTAYTVTAGDTLFSIAEKFGTTVEKLAAYNEWNDPDRISVGQVLNLPPADYEAPKEPTPAGSGQIDGETGEAKTPDETDPPQETNPASAAEPTESEADTTSAVTSEK